MRDIKFRALSPSGWRYANDYHDFLNTDCDYRTIGQLITSMWDGDTKTRTEMFEGDVILIQETEQLPKVVVALWQDFAFKFFSLFDDEFIERSPKEWDSWTVIGTVYDAHWAQAFKYADYMITEV